MAASMEATILYSHVGITGSWAFTVNCSGINLFALQWFPGVNDFEANDAMPMGAGKHFTESYDFPFYGLFCT